MIKTPQKITLTWYPKRRNYYVSKGYVFTQWKDNFDINVEDLYPGSHLDVKMVCDKCGEEFVRSFRKHKSEDLCWECSVLKRKETCLAKYGVEYPMQLKEIRDKAEQTNLEKYGVRKPLQNKEIFEEMKRNNLEKYGHEFNMQVPEFREKTKKTCLEKYGVEYAIASDVVCEKIKQTNLDRYGVEYSFQADEVKEKIKQTCLERYDVENGGQSKGAKEKRKQTCLEKYGVEYAICSDVVREKSKQTMLERYGVENIMKHEGFQEKMHQTCLEKYGVDYYVQTDEFKQKQLEKFMKDGTLVPYSKQQKKICDFVQGTLNYFNIGYFFDIALIDKRINIEYDGSGHDIPLKYNKLTEEEFYERQQLRDKRVMAIGWKILRIVCP
jgi:csr/mutH/archaeal HJR family nuclease